MGGGRKVTILLTINSNEGSVIMSNNMKEVAELSPKRRVGLYEIYLKQ